MVYSFDLHKPADDHFKVKAQGRKRLAYAPDAKNVWDALVDIDLAMTPENGAQPATISVTADLIDMVRNHRLQVARAAHTPAGMVAMGAFVALWLRVLFQSHFWSFRGLNYSKLKPPPAAQHGPINGALLPRNVKLPSEPLPGTGRQPGNPGFGVDLLRPGAQGTAIARQWGNTC